MINLLPANRRRPAALCLFAALFSVFFLSLPLRAQNADPLCSLIRVTQGSGQPGDTVWLEVRATAPDSIAAVQFGLFWNPEHLSLAQLRLSNSTLFDLKQSDFNAAVPGQVLFSWFDWNVDGVPLPVDALLFELGFVIKPGAEDFSPVVIGEKLPHLIFEAIVLPSGLELPENLSFGGVYNSPAPVNGPAITQICTNVAGCNGNGSFGLADISVEGGVPPYQFEWRRQNTVVGNSEDLGNVPAGKYQVQVTDQNGHTARAAVEIFSTQSNIAIQAGVTDDNCLQKKGRIDLTVTGGFPPYSYSWYPGNADTSSLSNLLGGEFYTVTVTDAVGCTAYWAVSLGSTAPPEITAWIENPTCGTPSTPGFIQITAKYGLPPYNYTWNTSGANGAQIGIPASGVYSVTVVDAGGCSATKTFKISDKETAHWTIFKNTLCDPVAGPGQILLFVDGADKIQWPLTAFWSTGATHTLNGSANFPVLDSLYGLPDGFYSVLLQDAAGCRKFVDDIQTDCETALAYDGKTCFQLRIGSASAQPGEAVFVPVSAKNFKGIRRIESVVQWDTSVLIMQGIHNAGLPYPVSVTPVHEGAARIVWTIPPAAPQDGLTMPDDTEVFKLFFHVKSGAQPGSSAIRFGPDYYGPGSFQIETWDPLFLGILGFEGEIQVGGPLPDRLYLNACAFLPTCATDVRTDYILDIANGTPPYMVQWDTGNGIQTGTLDDLKYRNAGKLYVTVTDQTGKSAAAAFNSFAGYGSHNCVWPGDADDNNAVNHYDLLYLGYAFGSSGIQRIEQGSAWQGYFQGLFPGWDWGVQTPVRHIDFSNMDCDGNGAVEASDIDLLLQHWGQVVRPGFDDPFLAPPLPGDVSSAVFDVFVQTDTLHTDSLQLAIQAGTPNAPATGINGLAFSIYYDTAAVQAATLQFVPAASWLGHPDSTLLWVQKNFPAQGRLDVALSRKGIHPQNGHGTIGHLRGLLADDMFRPAADQPDDLSGNDSMRITLMRIDHIVAMSEQEKALAAQGMETPVVVIPDILTGTKQAGHTAIEVDIRPNPSKEFATVYCPAQPVERLEVFSANGLVVQRIYQPLSAPVRLDTGTWPAGLYWIRVQTPRGSAWKKLSVQH